MVHSVEPVAFPHSCFPWYADTTTAPPLLARRRILWEAALTVWHTEMPDYRPCFIHRDFHPGNILWVRGRCSGIVAGPTPAAERPGPDKVQLVRDIDDARSRACPTERRRTQNNTGVGM